MASPAAAAGADTPVSLEAALLDDVGQAIQVADIQVCGDRQRARRVERLRKRLGVAYRVLQTKQPDAVLISTWHHFANDSCDRLFAGTSRDTFIKNVRGADQGLDQAERLLGISIRP